MLIVHANTRSTKSITLTLIHPITMQIFQIRVIVLAIIVTIFSHLVMFASTVYPCVRVYSYSCQRNVDCVHYVIVLIFNLKCIVSTVVQCTRQTILTHNYKVKKQKVTLFAIMTINTRKPFHLHRWNVLNVIRCICRHRAHRAINTMKILLLVVVITIIIMKITISVVNTSKVAKEL